MRRGGSTKSRGVERVPLTTRSLHEKDRLGTGPIRHPGPSATEKMRVLVHGQKWLDQGPKLVGQPKATAGTADALGVRTAAGFIFGR